MLLDQVRPHRAPPCIPFTCLLPGFALWYKRLEAGTFRLPHPAGAARSVELKASELAMLLEGIDLTSIKRRRRFVRPVQ
jgi:transposase